MNTDHQQYARTLNTLFAHTVTASLCVAVVGLGALGNEVIKALGLLGVGSVLMIDPDTIELSNLTRAIFFRRADCGFLKAQVLGESLPSIFPDTRWSFRAAEIADVGLEELAGNHLIFSCVDSEQARVEIAWMGLRLDLPVCDAGLGGPAYWRGRVSYFPGRGAACFACKLQSEACRLALSYSHSMGHSCLSNSGNGEGLAWPSIPTMAGIIGSLQVDFGLRCWLEQQAQDQERVSRTLELCLGGQVTDLTKFYTKQNADCPLHEAAEWRSLSTSSSDTTARELLDEHNLEVIELDWPMCVAARCMDCGNTWEPMKRLGWFRKHGVCKKCGGNSIRAEEIVAALDRHSEWADASLHSMGLPERHLYMGR